MSDTTTRGIRVQVRSFYDEERSAPQESYYFFTYQVRISNVGRETAQLVSREWFITDGNGDTQRVQGPGVIDMQQAILKRLRSEIDRLKNERTEIIANSKQNQIVQNRIQAAVISIIQASTFEKMIHVVTHELPELLDVDFITLAIEANADAPKRVPVRGVYVLAPGAIDAAIGPDKHARLRADIAGEELRALFVLDAEHAWAASSTTES